jgi:hypothetical protein
VKRGTPEHPKVDALCEILGIGRAQAVGHLELLWHFAAKYAIQGNVGKWPDTLIASRCGAASENGQAERFVAALTDARWLDRCAKERLVIHDWEDHCDQSVKKTLANNNLSICKPVQEFLEPDGNGLPTPGYGYGKAMEEKGEGGVGEGEKDPAGEARDREALPGFDLFWQTWPAGPRKRSKANCRTKWLKDKLERRAEHVVAVVAAMKLSRDWTKKQGEYIPAPLVFLNQARWDCELSDIRAIPPPATQENPTLARIRALNTEPDDAAQ